MGIGRLVAGDEGPLGLIRALPRFRPTVLEPRLRSPQVCWQGRAMITHTLVDLRLRQAARQTQVGGADIGPVEPQMPADMRVSKIDFVHGHQIVHGQVAVHRQVLEDEGPGEVGAVQIDVALDLAAMQRHARICGAPVHDEIAADMRALDIEIARDLRAVERQLAYLKKKLGKDSN